jgi:hypothetical protein
LKPAGGYYHLRLSAMILHFKCRQNQGWELYSKILCIHITFAA